jgi:hypothetical protein
MLKDYYETMNTFNLLKTRETFITMIQKGDLEKIIPFILSTEDNKQKFSDFLKISYNEAKKQNTALGKQFKLLLRSIIENMLKLGSHEDKQECADFIKNFFQ